MPRKVGHAHVYDDEDYGDDYYNDYDDYDDDSEDAHKSNHDTKGKSVLFSCLQIPYIIFIP
jgi:hypothetical protein